MSHPNSNHILCVDDEPNILRSLTRFLKMNGFEVSSANGAKEAMLLLEVQTFDAVICDMRMPGMSGAELLSRVKLQWPHTLRFLLTGYSDLGPEDLSLEVADLSGFIHKPWDTDELLLRLQGALNDRA